MANTSGNFRFRRGDSIGAADAENDQFLETCFVDPGDLKTLMDCNDPHCIILGRTGSGKTALLLEIEKRASGHVERISPESLSLNYIANSDAVRQFTEIGVNLDPFFKLLWRHVIGIEVLQHIKPVTESAAAVSPFRQILNAIRNDRTTQQKADRHLRVLSFLEKHSDGKFWIDPSDRVKGIITTLERTLRERSGPVEVSANVNGGPLSAGATYNSGSHSESTTLKEETEVERRQRFQCIINTFHLRELDEILDLLSEVLEDAGRNVYVIIDKLDLQWADESVRLRLTRALIENATAFTRVPRLKVLLAMRVDLLERVYRDARHEPGTQWEKIQDYCQPLVWDKDTLLKVLDGRVARLVADRYAPNYQATAKDILNPTIKKGRRKGTNTVNFILDRTWLRPRDLIEFFNVCISRATEKPRITEEILLDGEGEYSRRRLKSLSEEWQLEYRYLEESLRALLTRRPWRFRPTNWTDYDLATWAEAAAARDSDVADKLKSLAVRVDSDKTDLRDARAELVVLLYKIGVVGVQIDHDETARWASNQNYSLSHGEITESVLIYIHPGLFKALGIQQAD